MLPGVGAGTHVGPEIEEPQDKRQTADVIRRQNERPGAKQMHGLFEDINGRPAFAVFDTALHYVLILSDYFIVERGWDVEQDFSKKIKG